MPKTIIITGISGVESKQLCKDYAEKCPKKVKIYSTGEMIHEMIHRRGEPKVSFGNIPNVNPGKILELRDRTVEKIAEDIKINNEKYERFVIDTHALFFWKGVMYNAFDVNHLKQIPADMFITIINKPSQIKEKQLTNPQGKSQKHDIIDILLWQNAEINQTNLLSQINNKPRYVLPSTQNPEIIENLLDSEFLIYFSMPMTDADGKEKQEIEEFYQKLLNLGKQINNLPTPIIDPRAIDVESDGDLVQHEKFTNENQTVARDLYWYISRATHLIAFYPENSETSVGVSQEIQKAFNDGKTVFIIWPEERRSPFFQISNAIIKSEKEFFTFFLEHMKQKIQEFKRE